MLLSKEHPRGVTKLPIYDEDDAKEDESSLVLSPVVTQEQIATKGHARAADRSPAEHNCTFKKGDEGQYLTIKPAHVSGLKWVKVGADKKETGTPLQNEKLAEKLVKKQTFSEREWATFGVADLKKRHYIESSDGRLFEPTVQPPKVYVDRTERPAALQGRLATLT